MDHLAPEVTAVACIGQVRSLHDRGPKTSCELVGQTTETQDVPRLHPSHLGTRGRQAHGRLRRTVIIGPERKQDPPLSLRAIFFRSVHALFMAQVGYLTRC